MEHAGKPLTITVTQRDIDIGRKKSCDSCALALAAQRALGAREVWVNEDQITHLTMRPASEEPFPPRWRLPDEAARFVELFDSDLEVSPFTFTAQPLTAE